MDPLNLNTFKQNCFMSWFVFNWQSEFLAIFHCSFLVLVLQIDLVLVTASFFGFFSSRSRIFGLSEKRRNCLRWIYFPFFLFRRRISVLNPNKWWRRARSHLLVPFLMKLLIIATTLTSFWEYALQVSKYD